MVQSAEAMLGRLAHRQADCQYCLAGKPQAPTEPGLRSRSAGQRQLTRPMHAIDWRMSAPRTLADACQSTTKVATQNKSIPQSFLVVGQGCLCESIRQGNSRLGIPHTN